MKKLLIALGIVVLTCSVLYAQGIGRGSGFGDKGLEITEIDGSPDDWPDILKVSNGSLTDNGDGSFTLSVLSTATADTLYLKLDQTTPQTIVNGFPVYENGHPAFTEDHQLVDKEYVDSGIWLMPPIIEWWDPTSGLPVAPEVGDRYGSDGTGSGWTDGYIYEWDGDVWVESEPEEGWMLWDLWDMMFWAFFSGGWMEVGSDSYWTLDTPQIGITGDKSGSFNLTTNGTIEASGGNSTGWNTAFGWGNHAGAGYGTSNYTSNQGTNTTDEVTFVNATAGFFIGNGSLLTGIAPVAGNPFDQILNTTSSPTFATLNVTSGAYGVGWNGNLTVPNKDDVYDKINAMVEFPGNLSIAPEWANVQNKTAVLTTSSSWSGGDLGGTGLAPSVSDDSHLHTSQTVKQYNMTSSFVYYNITNSSDFLIPPLPIAININKLTAFCDGGTNVTFMLSECGATGTTCVGMNNTAWVAANQTELEIVNFGDNAIDAGDWMKFNITNQNGNPAYFSLGWDYSQQ